VPYRPADGPGGLLQMLDLSEYKPSDLFRTFLWHGHDFLIRKIASFSCATAAVTPNTIRGDETRTSRWQQGNKRATEDGRMEAPAVVEW
jgi:hypothetical protein